MFSLCATPDCKIPFDHRHGRLYRFHKDHPAGSDPPNTHSVQHFWLCRTCSSRCSLEYQPQGGVMINTLPEFAAEPKPLRLIAAA